MNSWYGIGRVTRDIHLEKTQNSEFARFTLAVDKYKKELGANFIPCIIWSKQAEVMANLVKKGEKIAVEGSIESGSYVNASGDTVYTLEVKVNRFEFLIPKAVKDAIEGEHARNITGNSTASTTEKPVPEEEHQEELPKGWQYVDDEAF
jgi:single-strand DNA-binding protein